MLQTFLKLIMLTCCLCQSVMVYGQLPKPAARLPQQIRSPNISTKLLQQVELKTAQVIIPSYGRVPLEEYHSCAFMIPESWELAESFPQWLYQNYEFGIQDNATNLALEAIRSNASSSTIDDWTYETLKLLSNIPVEQVEQKTFIHFAYLGDNPRLPRAKDFSFTIEKIGIKIEQVPNVTTLNNHHIFVVTNNRARVSGVVLHKGITQQDINEVFEQLIPPGFQIRMGLHEFAIQNSKPTSKTLNGRLHMHIEKIRQPNTQEVGIAYSLYVDAHELVKGKKPHQIIHLYRWLFKRYLDQDMISFTL